MLLMLAKEELVGHSGDVVANDDVPGFCASGFLVRRRHRVRRIDVVHKKLFETADRAVAVIGDSGMVVDMLEEKAFQLGVAFGKRIAEASKPAGGAANVVHGGGSRGEYTQPGGLDEIGGEMIEHTLESCIELKFLPSLGVGRMNLSVGLRENRDFFSQSIEVEELRVTRVVEIRGVVGDFIDPIDELTFQRRTKLEKILGKMREFRRGVIVRVLDDALADFEGKIQTGKIKIGTLKLFDDAKRLEIVVEARAMSTHQLVELLFAGMAEGWMPNVMDESESFSKLGIEPKCRGNRAGNLRHLQSMREPIAEVVGEPDREDLCLVLEAAEGTRVNDAVAVTCVNAAVGMGWLGRAAAA